MSKEWQGKWALVTGASAGIGVALANELAADGTHLVLTARRRDRLEELARTLGQRHGIRTAVCDADLTKPDAPEKSYDFTKQQALEIDLLTKNTSLGQDGELTQVRRQPRLSMEQGE